MKTLLIVNPVSGNRSWERKLSTVRKWFRRHEIPLVIRFTERRGHATDIARAAVVEGYDTVAAAGGDGTINEVLCGLAGSRIKLGILPWGTGNVFAREMGIPKSVRKQCRLIRKGRSLELDTGIANGRRFLLMASAGFDAYALKQMESQAPKTAGIWSYVFSGLKTLLSYDHPLLSAEVDGEPFGEGSYVLISNTSRYGAFFTMAPRADPTDGMLDVFVYREHGHIGILRLVFGLLQHALGWKSDVAHEMALRKHWVGAGKEIVVRSERGCQAQVDGDWIGELPLRVTVDPSSLRVILPGKTIRKLSRTGGAGKRSSGIRGTAPVSRKDYGGPGSS